MVSKTVKQLALGAAVALGFMGDRASAETVNTSFQVSATVHANCLQQAATDISHDVYDPLAADDDATGTITVRCTNGTPYSIALNVGTGGGSFGTRTLDDTAGGKLNFNLYRNAVRNEVWGDGSSSTYTVSGTGAGLGVPQEQSHTVYSRIPAGQNTVAPGSYSSIILVSITY